MGIVLRAVLLALLAFVLACPAGAQQFPTKPIRLVVPYPPGGNIDIQTRLVAQKLGDALGQAILVESRPGAGTMIATQAVAASPKDGYTLLMCPDNIAVMPSILEKPPFTLADFTGVALISRYPFVLGVHHSVPVKTIRELQTYAKANPGKLNYGTLGPFGAVELLSKLLIKHTGIEITAIDYKGLVPAQQALRAGEIHLFFDTPVVGVPMSRSGVSRALAITSEERLPSAPEIPTAKEQGFDGLTLYSWLGVCAPSGTPAAVIERLSAEVVKAVKSEDVHGRIVAMGAQPLAMASREFDGYMRQVFTQWQAVLPGLNIRRQ